MNIEATQPISSAPVEVSWTLPSSTDGAIEITGYRVFYGSQGPSVLVPSYINSMVLNFVDSSLRIESVSVRSESMQLPSELISVTVTAGGKCKLSINILIVSYIITGHQSGLIFTMVAKSCIDY